MLLTFKNFWCDIVGSTNHSVYLFLLIFIQQGLRCWLFIYDLKIHWAAVFQLFEHIFIACFAQPEVSKFDVAKFVN